MAHDDEDDIGEVYFIETEDSIDESVENILGVVWPDFSKNHPRSARKTMLRELLTELITEGLVVVPDDYMDDRNDDN